jgi:hypothetical protein
MFIALAGRVPILDRQKNLQDPEGITREED